MAKMPKPFTRKEDVKQDAAMMKKEEKKLGKKMAGMKMMKGTKCWRR
jgi:ribosomal protein S2